MLLEVNRSAVIITPNQKFFDHLAGMTNDEKMTEHKPDEFDASTIYLIPNDLINNESYWEYLADNYMPILEEEVEGWTDAPQEWIKEITFEQFKDWFIISFQSMIFDTLDEELDYEE